MEEPTTAPADKLNAIHGAVLRHAIHADAKHEAFLDAGEAGDTLSRYAGMVLDEHNSGDPKTKSERVAKRLVQTAAIAIRAMVDLDLMPPEPPEK